MYQCLCAAPHINLMFYNVIITYESFPFSDTMTSFLFVGEKKEKLLASQTNLSAF